MAYPVLVSRFSRGIYSDMDARGIIGISSELLGMHFSFLVLLSPGGTREGRGCSVVVNLS